MTHVLLMINFPLVNNVLREYDDMKEEIKNVKSPQFIKDFNVFIKKCFEFFEV